jgi:hypothetical protein
MIYFDWMRHLHLPPYRQLTWMFLHFPFHLSLVLFVEGASQFVIWCKILEVTETFNDIISTSMTEVKSDNNQTSTTWLVTVLNESVSQIFAMYPPVYFDTTMDISNSLTSLSTVPEDWWNSSASGDANDTTYREVLMSLDVILASVSNSLLASFDVDGYKSFKPEDSTISGAEAELEIYAKGEERYSTVVSNT